MSCLKHLLFADARESDGAKAAPGVRFSRPGPLGRAGSQTISANDIEMIHQTMTRARCWAQGLEGQGPFLTMSPALGPHPNIQTNHNLIQVLLKEDSGERDLTTSFLNLA